MRICLVAPRLAPFDKGGIATYIYELAQAYHALGHEVTAVGYRLHKLGTIECEWGQCISLDGESRFSRLQEHLSALASNRLMQIPFLWRAVKSAQDWRSVLPVRSAASAIASYLRHCDGEFAVIETPNWPGYGAFLRGLQTPVIVRLSTPAEDSAWGNRHFTNLERRTCKLADHVIANSHAMNSKGQARYEYSARRSSVIYHGVQDVSRRIVTRRSDGVDFLFVGHASERKGTDILLHALPEIFRSFDNCRLILIGAGTEELLAVHPDLRTSWHELRSMAGDRIVELGQVEDDAKLDWYARAHWTLIPSRFESFGLVAVESLRAGTPFVAAPVGGLGEIMSVVTSCAPTSGANVETWKLTLARLAAAGPGLSDSLRATARHEYESRFTADRMAQESLAVYGRVITECKNRYIHGVRRLNDRSAELASAAIGLTPR